MSEIASAYPTAGGLYYWASKMKNKNWGWWTAWFNLIGQFAIVAGIDYAAAGFINATIVDRITGGTFNTVLFGPINGQLVTMGVILLIQLALNIAGINLVALLNQVSVWWHIVIVAAVVILIFATGQAGPVRPDAGCDPAARHRRWLGQQPRLIHPTYGAAITYPLILAFLFSLLQANWTYTGYDASAHVAEETVGARMASAWGVFLSVAVSAVVGYIFLIALSTHLPSLTDLFPADPRLPPRRRTASTTSAAAWPSCRSSTTTSARSATSSPPASRSRCGSAACPRSAPPAGCCSRSRATTGSPVRAGSRRSTSATGPRPTR